MELKLGATYEDWDVARGDRINVYLDGEFVVELGPLRAVEASPGDQDAVVRETLALALSDAIRAGQRLALIEQAELEPWEQPGFDCNVLSTVPCGFASCVRHYG